MTTRALVVPLLLALTICAASASAEGAHVVRLAAVQDVSLPFWCEWGYDWDERCYRDDGDRLPVGGDGDKLWRAPVLDLRRYPAAPPSCARHCTCPTTGAASDLARR